MKIEEVEMMIGGKWTDRNTNIWFFEVTKDNEGYGVLKRNVTQIERYKIRWVDSINKYVIDTKEGGTYIIEFIYNNVLQVFTDEHLYSFEKR